MKSAKIILIVLGCLVFAGLVQAQSDFPRGNMGKGMHGKPDFDNEKMDSFFENLRMMKLLETLDLNEEESLKFLPVFHGFRTDMNNLRAERRTLCDTLSAYLERQEEEDKVSGILDELTKNFSQAHERILKFNKDVVKTLDIYQAGRMALFMENFERDVLKSLREFRGGPGFPMQNNKKENEG